jgi:hypothetical protein
MSMDPIVTDDGVVRERVVERRPETTTYVERSSGFGAGGVILTIIALALIAFAAFYLMNANRNDNLRTNAVTNAAASVSDSASSAAKNVSSAADRAADNAGQ